MENILKKSKMKIFNFSFKIAAAYKIYENVNPLSSYECSFYFDLENISKDIRQSLRVR